jgi:hypothetical protein
VVPSAELVVVRCGLAQRGDPEDGVPELAAQLLRALARTPTASSGASRSAPVHPGSTLGLDPAQ